VWSVATGSLTRDGHVSDVQTVFSGLYDDKFFEAHRAEFFASLRPVFLMNLSLLTRLYGIVVGGSIVLDVMILNYNSLRNGLKPRWMKTVLATIVLPRASEWHVLLSGMLLPSREQVLRADVLTRSNALYQGQVQDKMLGPDGGLLSLTLSEPRRFLREEFQRELAKGLAVGTEDFWKEIPGNLFVILGSDIANINLKYVEEKPLADKPSMEEIELLKRLLERLQEPE
jgi:hypothetical protein